MLRTHCQTSGWSLTAQDPFNNVARTTVEALAAVLGGTQSLAHQLAGRGHRSCPPTSAPRSRATRSSTCRRTAASPSGSTRSAAATSRDTAAVTAALDALTAAAEQNSGNLLDLAIKAIRLRATVGEVSDALEKVFGRHRADTQKVTGVYAAAYDSAEGWDKLKEEIAAFGDEQGRRPRVMIAKLGQDGHDRGAKVVATAFADLGFDVDMGPLFQTPEECARQAIENDVHAVGVSTLAAGHKTLVPAIINALKEQGADDIIVFVGGVIPRQDYDMLYEAGVKGVYGPGTPIPASAKDVLEQIRKAIA
jgi:methylmalonyl-CoA mutase